MAGGRRVAAGVAGALALALALGVAAWTWRADRVADGFFRGDPRVVLPLADAVAEAVSGEIRPGLSTGDPRFDGEWTLVTCQMAVLGLGQLVQRDPALADRYRDPIAGCGAFLRRPEARAFGTAAWGEDGLSAEALASDRGHAWLGWLGSALAMAQRVGADPEGRPTTRAVIDALARRLDTLPVHRIETYPGETYPPDVAAVVAAVAIDGAHPGVVARFLPRFREAAVDPDTGLLRQALDPRTGAVVDGPRGSGTTVAAFFLAHADPALAAALAGAARSGLRGAVLGFGGVREVPRGHPARADVDSGPVVFGLSVSASGFGLAAARVVGDPAWHRSIYRSAHAVGLPTAWGGRRWYWTGGALGNAILLAMLTAPSADPPPAGLW